MLIAVGCSENVNSVGPIAPTESQSVSSTVAIDGMIIELPEGWGPVSVPSPSDRLDTPRDRSGSQRESGDLLVPVFTCVSQRADNGEWSLIQYNWSGCLIPPGALPRNRMDIEVCVDSVNAICEFGPHGTQFNSPITIRIDFQYLGLDRLNIDLLHDIAIFYVQDNGTLLEMPHWVDLTGHALIGSTDHFSRYIVTQRISG